MRCLALVLALLAGCADAPPPPNPAAADALGARFPDALAGLARTSIQTGTDAALGASVTNVDVRYGAENSRGEPSLEIYLTDYGTAEMAEMMGLGWGLRDETSYAAGTEVQASEVFDGHPARRTWDTERRRGRLQVLAGETLFVEVRGEAVDAEALDQAVRVALGAP